MPGLEFRVVPNACRSFLIVFSSQKGDCAEESAAVLSALRDWPAQGEAGARLQVSCSHVRSVLLDAAATEGSPAHLLAAT